ncbi:MAG: amidophosphoribosyltransferase [Clostridia bacterium]|nr:amidophosphoribosyltransferase [Clostridia bacterium]
MQKLHEECGVFGIAGNTKSGVAPLTYYGLFALQHRGQESAGIVVNDNGDFRSYKDVGLVNDVFTQEVMDRLGEGNMAIGHVRYGTGVHSRLNSQPIVVNHMMGKMAIAHNGNITNADELRNELEMNGMIFHTSSDTELIAYMIIRERLHTDTLEEAIRLAMPHIKGAYSLIIMSHNKLIGVRDGYGFRPLCIGRMKDKSYVLASESCALDAVDAKFVRDVKAGEIVVFDGENMSSVCDHCGKKPKSLCVFEYIYFARPDSVIDGCSVQKARNRAGELLAKAYPVEADVVIGVPDSGLDCAIGYAKESGIPYGVGFIKNKYIGRTFIAPGQKKREERVRIKLNPVTETVKGKRVVLIDDSIVRGTTSARIVKLLREAGAKEVHMRVSAPPFINPCFYGTDIASKDVLIACTHTLDEIVKKINVDSLGYLSLEDAKKIAQGGECGYCTACFDGEYPEV